MTFDAQEQSRSGATPVELYVFTAAIQYLQTSGDVKVVAAVGGGSKNFDPFYLVRASRSFDGEDSAGDLTVDMSSDNPVAQLFIAYGPSGPLVLDIYRLHLADPDAEPALIFTGQAVSAELTSAGTRLTFASPLGIALATKIPKVLYQKQCPWALYGPGCGVVAASFAVAATITSLANRTIHADVFATKVDGWFNGGWLERSDGSRRYVEKHVGDAVTLQSMFASLPTPGETLTAFAGCDRSERACLDKFNNLLNMGGFERIPSRNPFQVGIAS